MRKLIDVDAFLKEYCEPYPHIYMAMSKAMADAPTIQTKQVKYFDEDENVWKIGSVIVE